MYHMYVIWKKPDGTKINHNLKWNKPDSQRKILYILLYVESIWEKVMKLKDNY